METRSSHQPTRTGFRRWFLAGLVVGAGLVLPVQAALPSAPGRAAAIAAAPGPAVPAVRRQIYSLTPRLAELARVIPCASPAPRSRGVLADWDRLRHHLQWVPSACRSVQRPAGVRLGGGGVQRLRRRAGVHEEAPFRAAELVRWRSLHILF